VKNRKKTDTIVIHCSDSGAFQDIGAEEIRHWHTMENGWEDIGYHFVIRRDGSVELGREIEAIGAHAYGLNRYSIGICMVGGRGIDGKPQDNFSDKQYLSLAILIRGLNSKYPGIRSVIGHGDVRGCDKTCPNFSVTEFLAKEGISV